MQSMFAYFLMKCLWVRPCRAKENKKEKMLVTWMSASIKALISSKRTCALVLESVASSNEEGSFPGSYSCHCLDPWDPHLALPCVVNVKVSGI